MRTLFFIWAFIFSTSILNSSFSQDTNFRQNLTNSNKVNSQTLIFHDIESGFNTNDVKKISKYFSHQPYISLLNGVNGYYSSNQAYYILEDFINDYKVVSFKIDDTKTSESVSSAGGEYYFERKGKREVAYLFVTLNKSGSKWQITQISIN